MDECHLEDLGFKGYPYTWNNKRPGEANTRIQLDRAIAMREWRKKFQLISVVCLAPHASDHLPIVLHTQKFEKQSRQGRRGFKFEESWLLWEECETIVKEAWTVEHNGGHGLAGIKQIIQSCGDQLRAWGFSKAKLNSEDIKQLQKRLENLNMKVTTEASKAEFLEVSKELDDLLMKQEIF